MSPTPVRPAVRAFVAVLALSLVLLPAVMPAQADVTQDFNHLWNAHIKPLLADKGTINSGQNPVDWTKLKGVHSSLADGTDYPQTLGLGLKKSGFGQGLGLDFEEISQNTGPTVFAGFKDETGEFCNDFCTEGYMNVPAGSYAIFAKIELHGNNLMDPWLDVECELDVGARVIIDHSTAHGDMAVTIPLMGVRTFDGQGYIGVNCRGHGSEGHNLKIIAIRLGSLTNQELQTFDD
ncbi:MAG: hypothetical protein WD770_00505 [Actinomycetota bacterium]